MLAAAVLPAISMAAAGAQAASRSATGGHRSVSAPARQRSTAVGRMPSELAAASARPAGAQLLTIVGVLSGVYCTSAGNCWAVGEEGSRKAIVNQVLHGNGRTWRKVAVPSPGGTGAGDLSQLSAVRCVTARDCWAVGASGKVFGGPSFNQVLHWTGRKWFRVRTPNPGGVRKTDVSELYDSTCRSSSNCWAVGDFGSSSGVTAKRLNQVLHWNGRKWSRVRTPNPGGTSAGHVNSLLAVRCPAASYCLAVGNYGTTVASSYVMRNEALRWNGRKWSKLSTPQPGGASFGSFSMIDALACTSSTSCWGAGSFGSYEPTLRSLNQILHWNGRKWTKSVIPNPGGTGADSVSELFGATCSSSRNCWAVGSYTDVARGRVNAALHWNGKKWSLVRTPDPGGTVKGHLNVLIGVRCTSSANCWAVGVMQSAGGSFLNEILHWNGKKWSVR